FNHVLFQQYLYDHLGCRERMILHANVGALLEEFYKDRTDDVAAQLARHYVECRDAEKAFEYLTRLATRAIRVSAYDEVLAQTKIALEMLQDLEARDRPSRELDVRLTRGSAFQATVGWSGTETIKEFTRARELSATLPPSPRLLPMLFGYFAE